MGLVGLGEDLTGNVQAKHKDNDYLYLHCMSDNVCIFGNSARETRSG
jgi:hypothetical protein